MKTYSQIYLVDDFDMSNLLHRAIFKKLDLSENIKVFTNPEKALFDMRSKLKKSERTLVLLDINMPEMSGFEFLDAMVRDNFPNTIDVIMASSSIAEKDRLKAMEYPGLVCDFITKPLKMDKLKSVLAPLEKVS